MAEVVVVGLSRPDAQRLLSLASVSVEWATPEGVADRLHPEETLAVLAGVDCGMEVAQRAHRDAPDAAVIFVSGDPDAQRRTSATLMVTPGISRHTTCVSADADGVESLVVEEVERSRLRMQHRRTIAALPGRRAAGSALGEAVGHYLGQLFDHAPVGILVADETGTIRAANPASTDVLGWAAPQIVGAAFAAIIGGPHAPLAADLFAECLTTGQPAVQSVARTGPDGATQHVELTVAPIDPERNLGVFILVRDETAHVRALEETDQARQAAEAAADKYAGLAWTLQESLLPPDLPVIAGAELGARFHPAGDGSEIGGDFYDIFQVPGIDADEWYAVIGDVCGKGAGAARLTALTRYSLRGTAARTRSLEQNLADLNAALFRQYERDRERGEHRFVTGITLRFTAHPRSGLQVSAGSGGHAPPLIVRRDRSVEPVPCRGPLLGMFEHGHWQTTECHLRPDDLLVTFTDGVTEARRGREEFGDDRLVELLARNAGRSADEVAGAIEEAVVAFQGRMARDDIAVLVVRATTGAGDGDRG